MALLLSAPSPRKPPYPSPCRDVVETHYHPAFDTSEQLQPLPTLFDIVDSREIQCGSGGCLQHIGRVFAYLLGILQPLQQLELGFAVAWWA